MIASLGRLVPVENRRLDGPAQRYRLEGACGEIGFIPAMSQHFCARCNRLRLTAGGGLRPCLLAEGQLDLKGVLRGGGSDEDIAAVYLRAVRGKPRGHRLDGGRSCAVSGQMRSIGG